MSKDADYVAEKAAQAPQPTIKLPPQDDGTSSGIDESVVQKLLERVAMLERVSDLHSSRNMRIYSFRLQKYAVIRKFAEQSFAVGVAWVTESCFRILVLMSFQETMASHGSDFVNFIACIVYAVFATVACTLIRYLLRGDRCLGQTMFKDYLKLMVAASEMIFAWAWKDVVKYLLDYLDHEWWNEISVAFSLMLVLVILQMTPFFQRAKLGVDEGGERDTFLNRMLLFPAQLGLATGFAVNKIGDQAVDYLRSFAKDMVQVYFFIQAMYCLFVMIFTITATLMWKGYIRAKHEPATSEEIDHHWHFYDFDECVEWRIAIDMERKFGQIFIQAMSFVFAWAISNTLNSFYFTIMVGCASPATCSYQHNFFFSCIISFVGFSFVSVHRDLEGNTAWGQTTYDLLMRAASLTVGWSWTNFFQTLIELSSGSMYVELVSHSVLLVIFWISSVILYHYFLNEVRVFRKLATLRKDELTEHIQASKVTRSASKDAVTENLRDRLGVGVVTLSV